MDSQYLWLISILLTMTFLLLQYRHTLHNDDVDQFRKIQASTQAYSRISNITRTKSQNLNVSRLVLQLSLCNLLKPGVKSRMKM